MLLGPVVVGTDGSPYSLAAVEWAAREAALRRAPLRILHAQPLLPHLLPSSSPPPARNGAHSGDLHEIVSRLARTRPGLAVSAVQVVDTAKAALVAATEEAVLLVVGARGAGGFAELLVGSVGLHTAARAYCPVVVVRPRTRPAHWPRMPARMPAQPEIVVGVNARAPGEAALDFAFATAERHGAALRAVHAWSPPERRGAAAPARAERLHLAEPERLLLAEALEIPRKRYPDVPVTEEAVPAGPAEALVRSAARAELLVVGRCGNGPHPPCLGPVAHAVLHHSTAAAVAVVPEQADCGTGDLPPCIPWVRERRVIGRSAEEDMRRQVLR